MKTRKKRSLTKTIVTLYLATKLLDIVAKKVGVEVE